MAEANKDSASNLMEVEQPQYDRRRKAVAVFEQLLLDGRAQAATLISDARARRSRPPTAVRAAPTPAPAAYESR